MSSVVLSQEVVCEVEWYTELRIVKEPTHSKDASNRKT
jgi:hypothetical protein